MLEHSDKYELFYATSGLTFQCLIFKETPASDDQTDFETNFKSYCNKSSIVCINPFGSKVLPGNKKIFTRIHGTSLDVQGSADNIDFVIPYNTCKIIGVDIIGAKVGDKANFKILDTPTGTISGTPNLMINQFGFNVGIYPECYQYRSSYDADLIKDLKLRIEYDAIDELLPRNILVNFILHEIV
jgi:hypothetical protein